MVGLFQESGPCEVVEIARGVWGTKARDWGWDRSSNILFIDQPNQVGFSYDTPTNGSLNLLTTAGVQFPPSTVPQGQPAYSFLNGTFSSYNGTATANTTEISAMAIWHMLQGFLSAFPQYNPGTQPNSTQAGSVGINLFAESYGGKYGPTFAALWQQQNLLRKNGSIPLNSTLEIRLKSLGIMQGCVDDLIQAPFYPIFANNNTYGIQALSSTDQQTAANSFLSSGGCQQQILSCRNAATSLDPQDEGDVASVNQICKAAQTNCNENVLGPYAESGKSVYDIAHEDPDPFPPSAYIEYLNTASLQQAIGVTINYTESNSAVANAFIATGDNERGNQVSELAGLLSQNVRIALIYGDRDYICNWLGGQAVSYSVASQSSSHGPFYSAGYADIIVNSSYIGGSVREYGNLSFSRVYDAGHLVPAYQPETAFTIFTRVIMGTDIATGETVNLGTFGSQGNANSTHTNSAPASPDPTCWIRNIANTCTDEQKVMIQEGEGVVIDGVLYSQASDWSSPASSIATQAGVPGTLPTAMTATIAVMTGSGSASASATSSTGMATGVYVATGPITTKKSVGSSGKDSSLILLRLMLGLLISFVAWI
ncbi:MAG: hypothetical protein M1827_005560 [Pycnora praestabilis]|nr:MAG: hypothetical protein M1827_005560 [Pycnora praestabilis]